MALAFSKLSHHLTVDPEPPALLPADALGLVEEVPQVLQTAEEVQHIALTEAALALYPETAEEAHEVRLDGDLLVQGRGLLGVEQDGRRDQWETTEVAGTALQLTAEHLVPAWSEERNNAIYIYFK